MFLKMWDSQSLMEEYHWNHSFPNPYKWEIKKKEEEINHKEVVVTCKVDEQEIVLLKSRISYREVRNVKFPSSSEMTPVALEPRTFLQSKTQKKNDEHK